MTNAPFKIYSLICSRDNNYSATTLELFRYFKSCNIEVKNLIGFKSIFNAYNDGFNRLKCDPNDIIIMCHDDIEVKMPQTNFLQELTSNLNEDGFIGVAGTAALTESCCWWENKFALRGKVEHGPKDKPYMTFFGLPGETVVMDGVFLACRASTLMRLTLPKPDSFTGLWDFYDLYFTFQSYLLGFHNKVVPIMIRHESPGNMRDSWHETRLQFYELYRVKIPATVYDRSTK